MLNVAVYPKITPSTRVGITKICRNALSFQMASSSFRQMNRTCWQKSCHGLIHSTFFLMVFRASPRNSSMKNTRNPVWGRITGHRFPARSRVFSTTR